MTDHIVCQIQTIPKVSIGKAQDFHSPLKKRIKHVVSRRLSQTFKRQVKMLLFEPRQWFRRNLLQQKHVIASPQTTIASIEPLKGGDSVRVRSKAEIMATLDRWGQSRGCSFLEEMGQYCGTTQEVFKLVRRFVDERDQNVKRAKGVVLLKNVFCQGTDTYGPCDRSCLFFWREEWLERVTEFHTEQNL